jgi:hypothetical protein
MCPEVLTKDCRREDAQDPLVGDIRIPILQRRKLRLMISLSEVTQQELGLSWDLWRGWHPKVRGLYQRLLREAWAGGALQAQTGQQTALKTDQTPSQAGTHAWGSRVLLNRGTQPPSASQSGFPELGLLTQDTRPDGITSGCTGLASCWTHLR